LTAKAFTSLVGWALGDALAQVCAIKLPWNCMYTRYLFAKTDTLLLHFFAFKGLTSQGTFRLDAMDIFFSVWILIPWSFWTLLLQLAGL
jgi:hypothetical protein